MDALQTTNSTIAAVLAVLLIRELFPLVKWLVEWSWGNKNQCISRPTTSDEVVLHLLERLDNLTDVLAENTNILSREITRLYDAQERILKALQEQSEMTDRVLRMLARMEDRR